MHLQRLSDSDLLISVRRAAAHEREATLQVLLHLHEVERRRLFLERGYPSLFEFCIQELGYCAGSAQIRIESMRLLRDLPSESERARVMEKIDEGTLKLTQLSAVQKHSRTVKVEQGRKVEAPEKMALLESLSNRSTRETEKIVMETLRISSSQGDELKVHLDSEAVALLEEFKALTSHSNPHGNATEAFKQALKLGVEASRRKRGLGAPVTSCSEVSPHQVSIPLPTQRVVWSRAQAQCSYVDPVTGRRCTGRHFLQIDHIRERSRGGKHDAANLRLLCHAHHRWRHLAENRLITRSVAQ